MSATGAKAAAPAPPAPVRLVGARFEHAGAAHRAHLRVHADGTGLVVADAQRLAHLDAAATARLEAWMRAPSDPAALEQALWHRPFLTGTGEPSGFDVALPSVGAGAVVPVVATVELASSEPGLAVARVRRAAELAVPHVVFRPLDTGAGPELLAGVRAAEDAGLVAGVAAPADFVDDGDVLDRLADLGLDHVALVVAGGAAPAHDALLGDGEHAKLVALAARAARLEVPLTADVPLADAAWHLAGETFAHAQELGAVGATAWALVGDVPGTVRAAALRQVATTFEHAADAASIPVTWGRPVRVAGPARAAAHAGPRTDGEHGVRLTLDGRLLGPRGHEPLARVDAAAWDALLGTPAWRASFGSGDATARCATCPGLAVCLVGCPADPESWT